VVLGGAVVALALAVVGAIGWYVGVPSLGAFRSAYIPMAPATSVVLVLLGGGLLASRVSHRRRVTTLSVAVSVAALVVTLLAAGVLLRAAGVFGHDFEGFIAGSGGILGGAVTGRMSWLTAVLAACAGLALLGLQWVRAPRVVSELVAILAGAAGAISLVVLVGYAYGTPVLSGGASIPVALPTGVAFLAISTGLAAALPRVSWVVRLFSGSRMHARLFRVFLPTTLLLLLLVGWAHSTFIDRATKNPALLMWVLALASTLVVGLVVFVVANRTGDTIDHAERALRESERKLRLISENTCDAIFAFSSDRHLLYVNPAAKDFTGYSGDELIRESPLGWCHPDDKADALADWQAAFDGLESSAEFRIVTRDGQAKWCSSSWGPMLDEQGAQIGVQGRERDITDLKQAEEVRVQLERQIQQSQRLESLGVLAGGIAHDFNNILLGVLGNADLALADLSPSAAARENLLAISRAAHRAAGLCRQMLAYSGRGQLVSELIDIDALIGDMVELLKSTLSKKVVLNLNLRKDLPPLRGDASQLSQVIMNLVINASEAIEESTGVVTISTGVMECSTEYLRTAYGDQTIPAGLYLTLEVADTGRGMDRETQSRLFEPFFTTKFTGRGLGLSAVLGIVRGHKGALRLYSEEGKGTTFRLLFPAAPSEGGTAAGNSLAAGGEWRGQGTILLVDDEEHIRALGARMLSHLGFAVLLASEGREALEVYRDRRAEIALVLLDLTMPRMDGEETDEQLRQLEPEVKVVISSGYAESDVASRFAGKGLAGFVQKPYTLAQLRDTLRAALEVI
jgi:PAS domain S-box-containing protein